MRVGQNVLDPLLFAWISKENIVIWMRLGNLLSVPSIWRRKKKGEGSIVEEGREVGRREGSNLIIVINKLKIFFTMLIIILFFNERPKINDWIVKINRRKKRTRVINLL